MIPSLLFILDIVKEHLTFTSNTPAAALVFCFVILFSVYYLLEGVVRLCLPSCLAPLGSQSMACSLRSLWGAAVNALLRSRDIKIDGTGLKPYRI